MTLFLQKKVSLVVTSPGFGSSSVNSGFVRLSKEPERKLSQEEIADKLTKWTKQSKCQNICYATTNNRGQQTWWFTDTIYSNSKF
jgi:hypothetical protein